jgi:predicted transposase/invertase (TIGR01784 family)
MANIRKNRGHYIPFISDYGFKVTFGNESNTLFLRKALQALINSPFAILEVEFDKTIFEGISEESRAGIYDIACKDEQGNHFIVEMQADPFEYFIHRLKFYGFQKMNAMVKKGKYEYDDLTKIYCIGILAHNINDIEAYHNIGITKNQFGEIMDDQMIFVTLELGKFNKKAEDCTTDLDKLAFTMKMIDKIDNTTQYPDFWTEEWLDKAIEELDMRQLSPEDRLAYEMTLSRNAFALRKEREKIEKATQKYKNKLVKVSRKVEATEQKLGVTEQKLGVTEQKLGVTEQKLGVTEQKLEAAEQKAQAAALKLKESLDVSIQKALKRGKLSIQEIAEDFNVSVEYVLNIQKLI